MSSHEQRRGGSRRGRGSQRQGNRFSDKFVDNKSKRSRQDEVNENCPIIKAFRGFQEEMDAKNDRYERIMKINRDITIDSKRLIFLLQRIKGAEDCETLFAEAEEKMKELHNARFRVLAQELENQDIFQFLRAFSPGLQEYIEAVTFYQYLLHQKLVGVDSIQPLLVFDPLKDPVKKTDNNQSETQNVQSTIEKLTELDTSDLVKPGRSEDDIPPQNQTETDSMSKIDPKKEVSLSQDEEMGKKISVPIPPTEYMLGVADFTGELMRMAINSVGSGDLDTPRVIADIMRVIHNALSTFSNTSRELRRKTAVLRQSLSKVERACYTLQVRGSEIPKHMLADVFSAGSIPSDNFSSENADYASD